MYVSMFDKWYGIRKKCYTTVVTENQTEMSTNITERNQIYYYYFLIIK